MSAAHDAAELSASVMALDDTLRALLAHPTVDERFWTLFGVMRDAYERRSRAQRVLVDAWSGRTPAVSCSHADVGLPCGHRMEDACEACVPEVTE